MSEFQSEQPFDLAPFIDHTLLKASAVEADIRRLCSEARRSACLRLCSRLRQSAVCPGGQTVSRRQRRKNRFRRRFSPRRINHCCEGV